MSAPELRISEGKDSGVIAKNLESHLGHSCQHIKTLRKSCSAPEPQIQPMATRLPIVCALRAVVHTSTNGHWQKKTRQGGGGSQQIPSLGRLLTDFLPTKASYHSLSTQPWVPQAGLFSAAPHSREHCCLPLPRKISLELFSVLGKNKSKIERELISIKPGAALTR